MDSLASLLAELGERFSAIRIVDIGALWTDVPPAYASLMEMSPVRIVGFAPVENECDALNGRFGPDHRYLPYAIADGGTHVFHRCNFAMNSSLLAPNRPVLDRYHNVGEYTVVEQEREIATLRLDEVDEARECDLLKIDVQGAEALVLGGAAATLEAALAVQVEVQFVELYHGAPHFAEIDRVLRGSGFVLHHFREWGEHAVTSAPKSWDAEQVRRRQLWADAVYVRDPSTAQLDSVRFAKLAVILHAYGAYDLTAEALAAIEAPAGNDLRERYVAAVSTEILHAPVEEIPGPGAGLENFFNDHYRIHNQRCLDHLASLELPLAGKTVLEVGAGPGDHTAFFLDCGCTVTTTDARIECVERAKARFPEITTAVVDMNVPDVLEPLGTFDIVYCYGLLYHLYDPANAIRSMAEVCRELLLIQTCVSPDPGVAVNLTPEDILDFSQSVSGLGCRPTREWLFEELRASFPFVYQTATQPDHPEFPTDWSDVDPNMLTRVIVIASKRPLEHTLLVPHILEHQTRLVSAEVALSNA